MRTSTERAPRWGLLVALTLAVAPGCRPKPGDPLGPPDSFALWTPLPQGPGKGVPTEASPLLVAKADVAEPSLQPIEKLLSDGFASEMLRTVYLLKQYVRNAHPVGRSFSDGAHALADDTLSIVVGVDDQPFGGRGLAISGSWFGGPVNKADVVWLAIGQNYDRDTALVQTLTGRLAAFAARMAASAGAAPTRPEGGSPIVGAVLVDGYRMAMEVIAREWRVGKGPGGVVAFDAGSTEQRDVFARVRENRYVLRDDGSVRSAADLLADPGVAATVIYRMAQTRGLAQRVAPDAFYAPVTSDHIPPGISPAAALGPVRNFQYKLLATWMAATLAGRPPLTITDLVRLYVQAFDAEKSEALRVFVVTTFGSTVKPGGVSTRADDARASLAELTTLAAQAAAGKVGLDAALEPTPTAPKDTSPRLP